MLVQLQQRRQAYNNIWQQSELQMAAIYQFNYTKDAQGRPVFNVNGSLTWVAKA